MDAGSNACHVGHAVHGDLERHRGVQSDYAFAPDSGTVLFRIDLEQPLALDLYAARLGRVRDEALTVR
jgi:hypothetical protein